MNWNQLLSGKRFGMEEYHERKHERTDFQRDYDRLIFSSPFRRLQNKTQVFPLPGSIFVHNRLTHSLEVSCVGRSLGNNVAKGLMLKYPDGSVNFPEIGSIVSAACLAHDMGNPPFGHSGERAISAYFAEGNGKKLQEKILNEGGRYEDFLHFEGNANAMRLLTHQFIGRRKGGFALTYSTLASIIKYPYSSVYAGKKGKFGFFQSEEEISNEIATALLPQLTTNAFDAVYFYGAGCGFPDKIAMVHRAIIQHLQVSGDEVEVNTDMLAAARGLCGHEPGIACIMGTGSNSCYYDGKHIGANVSPLGFILGDEGSGACLGKLLVGDILKNQMTPELKEKFLKQFNLEPADIIDRVYRKPFPNRFLASLSPFLAQNLNEPCVRTLVLNSFKAFLKRNVMQYDYQHSKVHFIGSVAFHYKEVLTEAAQEMGVQIGTILQSPMEGLINYHS